MVGAASLMILMGLVTAFFYRKGSLAEKPWLLKALIPTIFFPYIANTSGWIMTEMGRQPWIVYGLQTVDSAVTPNVSAGMILTTLIGFALVYAVIFIADVYLLQKYARMGPDNTPISTVAQEEVSLWN